MPPSSPACHPQARQRPPHVSRPAAELLAVLSQHQAKADVVDAHGAVLWQVSRLLGSRKHLQWGGGQVGGSTAGCRRAGWGGRVAGGRAGGGVEGRLQEVRHPGKQVRRSAGLCQEAGGVTVAPARPAVLHPSREKLRPAGFAVPGAAGQQRTRPLWFPPGYSRRQLTFLFQLIMPTYDNNLGPPTKSKWVACPMSVT